MYFQDINSKEELRKEYKRLSKLLHPDLGGTEEKFKEMLNEYQEKTKHSSSGASDGTNESKFNFDSMTEDLKKAFMASAAMEGVEVEIIGTWIWLSGNTIVYKTTLKEVGYRWASKKKMWYFGETSTKGRGKTSIEDIRKKYGSEIVNKKNIKKIS